MSAGAAISTLVWAIIVIIIIIVVVVVLFKVINLLFITSAIQVSATPMPYTESIGQVSPLSEGFVLSLNFAGANQNL